MQFLVFYGGLKRFQRIPIDPPAGEAGVEHGAGGPATAKDGAGENRPTRLRHTFSVTQQRRKTEVYSRDRDSIPSSSAKHLRQLRESDVARSNRLLEIRERRMLASFAEKL